MPRQDAVAITGYSHRLPGGIRTDDDFWRLLSEREIVREPVTDRYGRGYQPIGDFSGPGRFASPWEGLIREGGEKLFDRSLFGMSHHEMLSADPHVRMLLTCTWETCERAGWDLQSLRNSRTGVFIGAQVPATSNWRRPLGATEFSIASISVAMLANRISYHFNFMGPSLACCTACSASLTALHTAINALRSGDCDQAFLGSANYLGSARLSTGFNALGVISPDGKCHSFDADANGYMRSEGAFVFALKPLAAAERDGDPIHAVVEATAVNSAGAADGSVGLAQGRYITAPTRHAQAGLMRAAHDRAGRAPQEFDYIEAHATGTVVGDRMEGNAIAEAFGGVQRDAPLRVSSVKSNVGHMEAAAFSCALLKVVLMMQRRTFAPVSKNYLAPNPEIDFESCPMQVQTDCEPFPDHPVVVGVNSFGFGGANGHCVVREYRPEQPRIWSATLTPDAGFMIPLSARTSDALETSARQLLETLAGRELDLYALAGNLSRRRTHFAVRASFAARTQRELMEALKGFAEDSTPVAATREGTRRIAMVFSGQGTQWAGCGRALYDADPVFRRVIDAIEEHWRERSDISLREACFSAPQEALNEVQLAQPVIFMLQCALVELLKTWGVYPDCVVGHSSGEVAAAYACGALSLAEATHLVYHRATQQQRVAGSGRMLAVGLDRAGLERFLEESGVFAQRADHSGSVEIACENSPANAVACGKEEVLRSLMAELDRRGLQNRLIPGNIAFHSTAMDPLEADVLEALGFLDDGAFDADAPMVSSVTGKTATRFDSAYWWSNIRRPVRFAAAMETVMRDYRPDVVLEVAPHSALQPIIAQCLESAAQEAICIPTLLRDSDVCLGFQEALGALFRAGVALDFAAQYPRPEPIAHLLPGYPRNDQVTADEMSDDEMFLDLGEYAHGPLIGHRVPCDHLLFEARLSEPDFPYLTEHRVHHAAIMPAAGYIELLLQAFQGAPLYVETLEFLQPCPIPKTPVRLHTALFPIANAPDEFTFAISSRSYATEAQSELHARGKVRLASKDHPVNAPLRLTDIDAAPFEPYYFTGESDFYERVDASLGETFQYGPCFQNIRRVLSDHSTGDYLFDVEMDEQLWTTGRAEGYVANPALLDGGLQIFLYHLLRATDIFALPKRASGVTFLRPPTGPRLTCHVKKDPDWADVNEMGQFTERRGERSGGSIRFYDGETGDMVLCIDAYVSFNSNPRWNDLPRSKHMVCWQPKFVGDAQAFLHRLPDGEIAPAALIAALEQPGDGDRYACRVIEFAGGLPPEQALLNQCLDYLESANAQTEFWLVSDAEEQTRAHYDAFHARAAALRFACLDLAAEQAPDLHAGLLRPQAAEILLLHGDAAALSAEQWRLLRRLTVPGALALVAHAEGEVIAPEAGWTTVRAGSRTTLLQAPPTAADALEPQQLSGPRWVIGEPDSLSAQWLALLDSPEAFAIPYAALADDRIGALTDWPGAADLQAIDIFCGADPNDPTGENLTARLVAFVKALIPFRVAQARCPCRLTVATRRAAMDVADPRASAAWGALRSISQEIAADAGTEAQIDFRLVDLDAPEDLQTLAWLGACDLRERELAVRCKRVWAPRLVHIRERSPLAPADEEIPYRLTLDNPGQIGGLQMKTHPLPPLGPHDVEIDVAAAGLNFRDVMVTLGLLPALSYERSALGRTVGMEASGIVRRVGDAVRTRRVGDAVAFTQGGCIANRVAVNEYLTFAKPASLGMEEAASSLSVYVTAYYSLIRLARLRKGQRVLIHSAMGGVGQAAIALARHAGAEIYATAGSESKREQLRALGVRAAFDSHSYDWYDALMAATGGEGVDVALNALAGRHISLCLEALRPGGWHCEIGKVDIYSDNALSLSVFRKNLRFAAIDIDRIMCDDPELARELSQECMNLLERAAVPPLPITAFSYRDYAQALRLMTTGRHTGKLVLKAPEEPGDQAPPVVDLRPFLDPDATYLVTGGMGGFGRLLLPYLASVGARHFTLLDRDPKRRRSADWVRKTSALKYLPEEIAINIVQGDVAEEADVRRCVAGLQRPLKGVFHLAGALDDCLLADLTNESLAKVFAPKARGALNLHLATADCPLDHFVLFSSIASTLGNPGQVNYSAANGFVDGLAALRRREGAPALCYNLAAVAEAGMASRNLHVLRIMRSSGLPPVSADFAITNLDYAMRSMGDRDHLITALFARPPLTVDSPDYMRAGRTLSNPDAFAVDTGGQFTLETVVEQIAAKVAELCGHNEGGVEEPLSSFGLTSISVAELGAFIRMQFNYQVSALELMTTASALSLARDIIHGKKDVEEDRTEADASGQEAGASAGPPRIRRAPSAFANPLADHFPQGDGAAPRPAEECIAR